MAAKPKPKRQKPKPKSEGESAVDLFGRGARVVSICGPFGSRALLDVPTEVAEGVFVHPLAMSGPSSVIDAVARDLDAIRERDAVAADSALAATATRLAYELENPYNSATSKSMCAKALIDALDRLQVQVSDADEEEDRLDELSSRRAARLAGGTAAKG